MKPVFPVPSFTAIRGELSSPPTKRNAHILSQMIRRLDPQASLLAVSKSPYRTRSLKSSCTATGSVGFGHLYSRSVAISSPVSTQVRGFRTLSSFQHPTKQSVAGSAPRGDRSTTSAATGDARHAEPLEAVRTITRHENIYTIPNILTFTRLLAAPGLAYLIMQDQHLWTLGLFAYAGITDFLDGWIARKWNQRTVVGTIVDPMADKTLMMSVTLALAAQSRLPVPLAVVILGRDALLGLAALYYRYVSLPPPKTMARYWDFSLPSAEVHPTGISKVNTALQLALIGATVAMPVLPANIIEALSLDTGLLGFQWLVGGTTIWSGLSYIWSKDAVKILSNKGDKAPHGDGATKRHSE